MKRFCIATTLLLLPFFVFAENASSVKAVDDYTLKGTQNFLSDIQTGNEDGTINVVIEIPTGTTGKWEVNTKDATTIIWEFKKGKPRTVDYLNGYPANYGLVPRTAMPAEFGGDGEAIDMIVIGDALPRGEVVKVKVLGIFHLQEGDEFDGKLVSVLADSPMAKANSLSELNKMSPGIVDTVSEWFGNYKGPGEIELTAVGSIEEAMDILLTSAGAYEAAK